MLVLMLLASLLLSIALHFANEFFHTLKERSANLQTELQGALTNSIADLRAQSQAISEDKSLAKNLTWQLHHSIRQSILNVVNYNISKVSILDANCSLLWGEVSAFATSSCRVFAQQKKHIFVDKKKQTVAYIRNFASSKKTVLIFTQLGEKWLEHYPSLQKALASAAPAVMRINSDNIAEIHYEYQQSYLRDFSANTLFYKRLIRNLLFALYALMLVLVVCIYITTKRFSTQTRNGFAFLNRWSADLHDDEQIESQAPNIEVEQVVANLNREIKKHTQPLKELERQFEVKNTKLLATLEKNSALQVQLQEKDLSCAILLQIKELNSYFLHHSHTSKSLVQDLHHNLTHLCEEQLDVMLIICRRWEQEFSQRRFVDFLGSYHSSPQEKLLLQLKNDLRQLFAVVDSFSVSLQDILLLSQRISRYGKNLQQPLLYWEKALASSEHNSKKFSCPN